MNANWMIVKAMQSEDLFWFMEKVLVILFQILGLGWYEAISSSQGRCLPKFAPFLEKKEKKKPISDRHAQIMIFLPTLEGHSVALRSFKILNLF